MTPEQATEQLSKAIIDHAAAFGMTDGDELLSEWAIVSNWQPVQFDGASRYLTQFPAHEATPFHVAVGMFEVGAQLVRECSESLEDE